MGFPKPHAHNAAPSLRVHHATRGPPELKVPEIHKIGRYTISRGPWGVEQAMQRWVGGGGGEGRSWSPHQIASKATTRKKNTYARTMSESRVPIFRSMGTLN